MADPDAKALIRRSVRTQLVSVYASLPALIYLLSLYLDLSGPQLLKSLVFIPPLAALLLPLRPRLIGRIIHRTLARPPGEANGERLSRLLSAPRRLEGVGVGLSLLTAFCYVLACCIWFDRPLWLIVPCLGAITLVALLVSIFPVLRSERLFRSLALQELWQHGVPAVPGRGWFFPRLSWYLPYTFALAVLSLLATLGGLAAVLTARHAEAWAAGLAAAGRAAEAAEVHAHFQALVAKLGTPFAVVGVFMLVVSALAAYALARHQSEGARALRDCIESLASGSPHPPRWISTTELGELAIATTGALTRLGSVSTDLRQGARALSDSAAKLGDSSRSHGEVLRLQTTSLGDARALVAEVRLSSTRASTRARELLAVSGRAEEVGRSGGDSLELTLGALSEIGGRVAEMAKGLKTLEEQAEQISAILVAVQDLSDQSMLLSLNAAIEAARSGEAGLGFAVVAREIRALAQRSAKETKHIRDLVQSVEAAFRAQRDVGSSSVRKVDTELNRLRQSGQDLQELSQLSTEIGGGVREIAATVQEQDRAIVQVLEVIEALIGVNEDAAQRLTQSDEVVATVSRVAKDVSAAVEVLTSDAAGEPKQPKASAA